jgi:2-polyprenyl-3-methyl-5-hydroxy-6-metoxy-1,4-benzoquinol methylase
MSHPADDIIDHYERHALAFEADRRANRWNEKPWHDRFVEGLRPGATVLDLGCGAGCPVAAHLQAHGLRVTGVDASPAMISLCRQRLPDHEWIVADMRGLALARRFDGILAWDNIFHLDHAHQRAMFAVFAGHARSGTLLMFNTGDRHGEAIGEYRGDPLYSASLAPGEYRSLLDQAGFDVVEHALRDDSAGGRTIWLCRAR